MQYLSLQRKSDGSIWRAGNSVLGLCAAWNHATDPADMRTDHEHCRYNSYARAIKNRMKRLGITYGVHYRELGNGSLFPNKAH